jgi:hypothetical protein
MDKENKALISRYNSESFDDFQKVIGEENKPETPKKPTLFDRWFGKSKSPPKAILPKLSKPAVKMSPSARAKHADFYDLTDKD